MFFFYFQGVVFKFELDCVWDSYIELIVIVNCVRFEYELFKIVIYEYEIKLWYLRFVD